MHNNEIYYVETTEVITKRYAIKSSDVDSVKNILKYEEDCSAFSQTFEGEQISKIFKISEDEYIKLFDKSMHNAQSVKLETKLEYIFEKKIDPVLEKFKLEVQKIIQEGDFDNLPKLKTLDEHIILVQKLLKNRTFLPELNQSDKHAEN